MSKPVKELVRKELIKRLEGVESLAVVGFTGLDAVATNRIRGQLREKDIRLSVVKNSLAKQAFKEVGLSQACDLLDGPCAVAFSSDAQQVSVVDVVRQLMEMGKESPQLTVKAALLDGEVFGPDRVKELSNYPTRDEALATVVSCALAPAGKLAGCLIGPGGKVASLVKAVEEKASETQAA